MGPGLGGAPGVEQFARFAFGMSRWGRRRSLRDTAAFLPFEPVRPQPRARSQVNVQSTGRWAGPISADGMLPESVCFGQGQKDSWPIHREDGKTLGEVQKLLQFPDLAIGQFRQMVRAATYLFRRPLRMRFINVIIQPNRRL